MILNLQPTERINYESTTTGEWLAHCGACPTPEIANALIAVGYLAGYAADALVNGAISGEVGDKFTAGDLGEKEVVEDGDGTQIMLGDPFKFDASNIAEWKEVY